ncbi:hypothetical protein [Actinospica robiniae]|uniref:hypothetical protein n=1 Tax=Actinospica robiniae TaxID=304901 RepID=UPI0012F9F4FA|nr:hypothetical protein [Actinospica robiniae]
MISPSVGIALAAPPLAAALGTWLLLGRAGVELTPEGAIVRTLRRRQIAWRDVQYVQIQRFSGNRVVVLYEAGGRRTRLRAPSTGFLNWDKRFEEKADVIGRWWETHRGVQDSVQASVELGGGWGAGGWNARNPGAWWRPTSRIRLATVQIVMILMLLGSLTLQAFTGFVLAPAGDSDGGPGVLSATICLVVTCLLVEAARVFAVNAGVTARAEGLQVHKQRGRLLPWTEIASFSVETTWHGSRLVAHEVSGRRTRLSGPRIGFLLWDDDFAAKAWAVDGWWRAATGATAPPLDLSGVRRAAGWKKVLVGLVAAALTAELLLGALVSLLLLTFA